ncbi:urea ABC transporter, permease protein UrtB [Klebsiella pneumoniae]|uniref:Urea ABC transporter, permease protein UrtB n=1 Tax=Klebsiella pneumoniae TaxID=573 RepID=A0A377TUM4_KLEPN|nr:urea ABC transporter, permease protein UrtB [Klebsiella pneumoniae]
MNALRLMSVLALLLTLLPWRAQAAEADDFVAASRSQQAQLLTQWAAAPQADRLPLLRALTTESLVMDDGKHAFRTRQGGLQPLGAVAAPQGENPAGPSDQPAAQSGCRRAGQPPYFK